LPGAAGSLDRRIAGAPEFDAITGMQERPIIVYGHQWQPMQFSVVRFAGGA